MSKDGLFEFLIGGQKFRYTGTASHTKKSGDTVTLTIFDSFCAECGAPFVAKSISPPDFQRISRRCDRCKNPGKKVKKVVQP